MSRILITGGSGYIGSNLFSFLTHLGFKVFNYDLVNGQDINNLDELTEYMTWIAPHIVIHLAALSSVPECESDILKAIQVNGIGTQKVLKAMATAKCHNIIYASTAAVYDNRQAMPLDEESAIKPVSKYGLTKLLGEHAIYNHFNHHKGGYIIMRMFNVVGVTSFHNEIKPGFDKLFDSMIKGHVTIYGTYPNLDGTAERDYVSLKDVCCAYYRAIITLSKHPLIKEIVNISSGNKYSVLEIIQIWNIINKSENIPPITFEFGDYRPGDCARCYSKNNYAKELLHWQSRKSLTKTIKELVQTINDRTD